MIQKKVCLLGGYAVGKTSLVERFVHRAFPDRYLTTVGVKLERRQVQIEVGTVELVLWDIHGEDEFQKVRPAYLRGAAGLMLVADGTRPETLEVTADILGRAEAVVGEVPRVLLVNKADLAAEWKVSPADLDAWRARGVLVFETSARNGSRLEEALVELAARVAEADER